MTRRGKDGQGRVGKGERGGGGARVKWEEGRERDYSPDSRILHDGESTLPLSRRSALSLFDNNTLSEHRGETVSTYNHLRVTAILNFCLRNNPARLLAAAVGGKGRRMVGRGGGSTSFPRSLQWVYSNTERRREGDGERNRESEREMMGREKVEERNQERHERGATEIASVAREREEKGRTQWRN